MFLMMLIMSLPLLGLGLFDVLPFWTALIAYLAALGFFAVNQCLMMGAMRLPVRTGPEKMAGTRAAVLDWHGNTGQVIREGEIWQAESKDKRSFVRGQRVAISRMSGLRLFVEPAPDQTRKTSLNGGNRVLAVEAGYCNRKLSL